MRRRRAKDDFTLPSAEANLAIRDRLRRRAASAHYARSQPWVRRPRGMVRGTTRRMIPSAAGAISEIAHAIGAASTCAAREYASCKQLVGEKLHAGAAESHARRR
jgi:hypothetical protein